MNGIEGSCSEAAAKDSNAIFADILCQVDGFRSRSQAFPAALPKLESGLGADQDFTDSEGELRKVADGLAVIFDSNFESPLAFCRSGRRSETREPKSGAGIRLEMLVITGSRNRAKPYP